MNEYRPPRLAAYLSGTFTAGIGFVGSVVNWRARGSAIANAKKKRITIAMPRMRAI
jgi:recombination DNA repair RAD52 pathway protein